MPLPARIIPARAGFTRKELSGNRVTTDHPRSRGVYSWRTRAGIGRGGSSPLARGLRGVRVLAGLLRRIIPARAGFTSPSATTVPVGEDHPRSRGVYNESEQHDTFVSGSSPLARGLPDPAQNPGVEGRIIPARAGFTSRPRSTPPKRGDHPRSRGVYHHGESGTCGPEGSSPLARGLHARRLAELDRTRIIPARAGFTDNSIARRRGRADHPRSRGVYSGDYGCITAPDRIIPARAGFTAQRAILFLLTWDHPRSRGVYG